MRHGALYYGRSGSEPIKSMAIRRLRDCYASLDPAHQQDFARHAWHSAENDLPSHQRFWQDVVEQIL